MITEKDIPKIEKALGIKLFPLVIKYLTTNEKVLFNGRILGRTTAYIIKLALCKNREITLYDLRVGKYNDLYYGPQYNMWFTREFLKIRDLLKDEGFQVIKLKQR